MAERPKNTVRKNKEVMTSRESGSRLIMVTLVIVFSSIFVLSGLASALEVGVEPAKAQRDVGGKVRMHIIADNAVDLLSTGIKVSFDPNLLQVVEASTGKNTAVWTFEDLEPDPLAYAPVIEVDNTGGTVTMIGGRLRPGVTGSGILLGWVTFQCIQGDGVNHTTSVPINVQLAKPYNASPPPSAYNNYVKENGDVEDPGMNIGNTPTQLATICIVDTDINPIEACEGDFDANGYVTGVDFSTFRSAMGSSFGDPNYDPEADLDANEYVTGVDFTIFRNDMGRTDCPCAQ